MPDPCPMTAARRRSAWLVVALLLAALPLCAWRLTFGVNLGDEGYYAAAPVSWLRTTPTGTGNLSVHQFSGVLTYPLVRLYAALRPDLHGLILFLRACYGLFCL